MFKFTQLVKENVEFEDIEDALLPIYDMYGEPRVVKSNIDGGMAYSLRWDLGFSLSEYNGVEVLDKTAKLFTSLSELKSTQKRLTEFDIDFKVGTSMLFVRFIPKKQSKEAGNYKFIIGQNGREIQLKLSEIVRFYRDKGVKMKNVEYEDNEMSENCSITISTESSGGVNSEFEEVFTSQYREMVKQDRIDREIGVSSGTNYITIEPYEEKTYIVLDADF